MVDSADEPEWTSVDDSDYAAIGAGGGGGGGAFFWCGVCGVPMKRQRSGNGQIT